MSDGMSAAIGIVAGLAVVAGALVLALRPYLGVSPRPWMPDPTGRDTSTVPDAASGGVPHDGAGHF